MSPVPRLLQSTVINLSVSDGIWMYTFSIVFLRMESPVTFSDPWCRFEGFYSVSIGNKNEAAREWGCHLM
jgi:hypothetical protein